MAEDAEDALLHAFLAGLPEGDRPAEAMTLGPALARLCAEARSAWPDVALAPEVFVRHLAGRLPRGAPLETALADLHASDVYVALAAAHGDGRALAVLEGILETESASALTRIAPDAAFVDEVRQQLRQNLYLGSDAPKLLTYSGHGPLSKWVRAAALRAGLSLQRAQPQAVSLEEATEAQAPGDSPELEYLKRRYRAEFQAAFAEACRALTPKERNLLRLHLLDGLTFGEMGAHYQAHRATVMRWVDAARQRLYDEARRLLSERLHLGRAEFDSLAALVRSELDLRLSRFLRTQPDTE